jgi:hypothetical protein
MRAVITARSEISMPAKLNHTIVAARDQNAAALFMSEVLGLDPPVILGPFALVKVGALLWQAPYSFFK